jgi:hypothetical protein
LKWTAKVRIFFKYTSPKIKTTEKWGLSSGFWVLSSEFWVLGSEFWVLGSPFFA